MLGQALNLINGPTIATAIAQSNNSITQLVAEEKDDNRLVDELFVRILSRPPTTAELQAGVKAINTFDDEQTKLAAELAAREKTLPAKQAEWEGHRAPPEWKVLAVQSAKSAAGAELNREADEAILASGKLAKDVYTIETTTDLSVITGIRLEALTDPRLPHGGPGRSPTNGNQVLTELRVTIAPKNDPTKTQPVALQNARADYSQPSWDVSGAIDGNPGSGWALDGQEGRNHFAIFECKQPAGAPGGSVLTFTFDQQFPDGTHELGKFRLSATTAKQPIGMAPAPANIAAILAIPADKRTDAQKTELASYFRSQDAEYARLTQAVAQHANDRANARLMGAQDLVWALLNSPAFLFNR